MRARAGTKRGRDRGRMAYGSRHPFTLPVDGPDHRLPARQRDAQEIGALAGGDFAPVPQAGSFSQKHMRGPIS